jgi:hypothetical protein
MVMCLTALMPAQQERDTIMGNDDALIGLAWAMIKSVEQT